MTTDDAAPLRLSLDELVVPDPRPGVPFADAEDQHAEDILTANGVPLTASGLQAALDSDVEVLQSAAARVAGAGAERGVLESLRALASGNGDTVRAAAAYALARLGEVDGVAALLACLELPIEAYLAAVQAAGSLARLGDPRGLAVVERALRSSNSIVRTVATKQLLFFDGLEGADARALLARAASDSDPQIARQARSELDELEG
jgi:HEAT repeat protein